ncbi:MAG: hypothetical protein AB8B91_16515 [Rubripirellula sp.]
MSQFKACAAAIRHKGFDEAAAVVDQFASENPKLFASVSYSQGEFGDVNGFCLEKPCLFMSRKSAKADAERRTCDLVRTMPTFELVELLEISGEQVDAASVSSEAARILGKPIHYPGPDVQYWNDPLYQTPLVPADASHQQALAVADLLRHTFFKVVSVPCDVHLQTPSPNQSEFEEPAVSDSRASENPGRPSKSGPFSFLNWFR